MSQKTISNFFPTRKKRLLDPEPPSKKRKLYVVVPEKDLQVLEFLEKKEPRGFVTPVKNDKSEGKKEAAAASAVASVSRKLVLESSSPRKPILESPGKSRFTPEEIKAKLGKVSKLSDLQARLKALSSPVKEKNDDESKEEKQPTKIPAYKKFSDLVALKPKLSKDPVILEVPQSPLKSAAAAASPLKSLSSPSKRLASPRKDLPAYERFHDLAQPQEVSQLPLPNSYRILLRIFAAIDQVVSMKYNRNEIIRVQDLKQPFQTIIRRDFKESFLEQIRCVFPEAYDYVWEKKKGKYGIQKEDYEMHMSPNLNYKEKNGGRRPFTALLLVERKNIFKNTLLSITMDHHKEFLLTLDPPIHVKDEKLVRWHREFDPNVCCPPIDVNPLPPKPDVEKFTTASEVVARTQELFSVNPRLEKAVLNHHGQTEDEIEEGKRKEEEEEKEKLLLADDRFKGLKPSLIRKILAKEKAKIEKELTRSPKEMEELTMIEGLPELSRVLRNRLIVDKKAALPMDYASKKLSESTRKEPKEVEKSLRLLNKLLPDFLEILFIRKIEYVKIDKNAAMNDIEAKLKAIRKQRE